jgi:cell division protein FtsL
VEKGGLMRAHAGLLRLALAYAALLLSLSLVVWRQSRALEVQGELDRMRMERAIAEATRSELTRRIEHLESRARVVQEAGARLKMRVPGREEIVILPLAEPQPGQRSRLVALGTTP